MFIIGTGNCLALTPPMYWNNGKPTSSEAALATAIETPNIALAPNLPLFGVPSNSIITASIPGWSVASIPSNSAAIISFTLATAFSTPFPRYLDLSPSLKSTASKAPVEAPDGTIALPVTPLSNTTSTSTVGLPLESNTSLAYTNSITDISLSPLVF
ncbi:hypothetical protein SDC9_183511 [bioreactor metagenome]|uniref:Uncharacterized protein n=1 Tax=bioreactor metagenome TaxID=1076179 RepID=A0A645HBV9_9ZZZZ